VNDRAAALRAIDSGDLLRELRRRLVLGEGVDATVAVGDLLLDPVEGRAVWRGHAGRLTPRETEVLWALALARSAGLRWVRAERLAHRIWRVADASTVACLRVCVCGLRRKFPGLVVTARKAGPGHLGCYGLAVADQPACIKEEER
jgi:DNA-binding response OmpR family regulator